MIDKEKPLPFPPLPNGEGVVTLICGEVGSFSDLEKQVTKFNKNGRLYGTLNRPKNDIGLGPKFLTINEHEAAFSIVDLKLKKTNGVETLTGLVKVLKTPHGEILDKMMANGAALGIAPRAYLQVDSVPGESGLKIVTWDVVQGEKK